MCYANSTDGYVWHKPELGLVDLGGAVGTKNNVVMQGGGIGVYIDQNPAAANGSTRHFKAVGALKHSTSAGGGTIESADGLHWDVVQELPFPDPPQRYDTANNVMYDAALGRYVLTTRRHPTTSPSDADRAIGIALSVAGEGFRFDASLIPPLISQGTHDHQLYAQVTWKWAGVYLGIVMVYDATDKVNNRVHCRLAYSKSATPQEGWGWVDPVGLTGRDIIPLGKGSWPGRNDFDSHLCYASLPVHTPTAERLYYMGSNGKHSGSKPHRNASLGLALLRPDGYAGLAGTGNVTTHPIIVAQDAVLITADILDASPIHADSTDPHANVPTSTSYVRVGIRDPSADGDGGWIQGLSPSDCTPVQTNGTDVEIVFHSGATLKPLIGKAVVVVLELHGDGARVYTLTL